MCVCVELGLHQERRRQRPSGPAVTAPILALLLGWSWIVLLQEPGWKDVRPRKVGMAGGTGSRAAKGSMGSGPGSTEGPNGICTTAAVQGHTLSSALLVHGSPSCIGKQERKLVPIWNRCQSPRRPPVAGESLVIAQPLGVVSIPGEAVHPLE